MTFSARALSTSVVAAAEVRDARPVEVPSLSEFFATMVCYRICLKINPHQKITLNYVISSISVSSSQ